MHFAMFVGSEYEALKPIVELEQVKRAREMVTGTADRQDGEVSVGDWRMDGEMGVIDVGDVHLVHRTVT